jgi:hypothetical protein
LVAGNPGNQLPEKDGPFGWAKRTWLKVGTSVEVELPTHPSLDNEWMAIGGGPELLRHSEFIGDLVGNQKGTARDARTLVGITKDRRHLVILVAEQYSRGWPFGITRGYIDWAAAWGIEHLLAARRASEGVSFVQGAFYLRKLGAEAVINLDGGSSTEMVVRLPGLSRVVLNHPAGSRQRERALANGLAFRRRQ